MTNCRFSEPDAHCLRKKQTERLAAFGRFLPGEAGLDAAARSVREAEACEAEQQRRPVELRHGRRLHPDLRSGVRF